MAEALTSQVSFSCSVCMDLLKDPVTVPCGHSFCLDCIIGCWDQDDQHGVYSCPKCRKTFTPRPFLYKNSLIAEMVERLRLEPAHTTQSPTGPGDVGCDVCTGTKHKAVKSCLECLVSCCEAHIQTHCKSSASRKHSLVEVSAKIKKLRPKTCFRHDKLLELFCRTDQSFICFKCTMDEHNDHDTISTAAERSQMQKQLVKTQTKLQEGIQQREKKLQDLRKAVVNLKCSAQEAVENTEELFTELIQSIKKRRSEVKKLIRAQEKAELTLAEQLLKKLEAEIADLKRRDAELEHLFHVEDHIYFLQSFPSVSGQTATADLSGVSLTPHFSIEELKRAVSGMKEQVESVCSIAMVKSDGVHSVLPYQPTTRQEFWKHYSQITLDPSTAHKELCLSDGNRKVTWSRKLYFDFSEILDECRLVMCRQSVTGRCYWEVAWGGKVQIAVSYKGPSTEREFGCNEQSWSLICSDSSISFRHNNQETKLPTNSCSSRIGVYVDQWEGILSFYSISDAMMPFLRVKATFTQPLYPGFGVWSRTSFVHICEIH